MSRKKQHLTAVAKSRQEQSSLPKTRSRSPRNLWICLTLFVATLAVYTPVLRFDFVNYDDPEHVSENVHARRGITLQGLVWAFTSGESFNWFPVTRLSHMVDCQLFGLRSGLHHVTSAVIHAAAAMLLFAFLVRITLAFWPSALVAFLFALHPLHVESVAWVAERKDVLCAFFWFLGLWAYVRYVERPSRGRYLLVVLAFCLGLMSKPMIVTFPFVLLLLDVWPLRRFSANVVREKIPLFVLSAGSAVVTYLVQQAGGSVQAFTVFPLGLRVENVLVSYVVYIVKMFWPSGLAVFYPYPASIPTWQVATAGLALAAISALAIRGLRDRPYLVVGWLWYLVTLGPVIGLVQVGGQARADRYMYVPMVGLAIMLAWGAVDIVRRWPRAVSAVGGVATVACLSCVSLTWAQIQHWQNSETLFKHALAVTGTDNYVAHHNLGLALAKIPGRLPEAISHMESAVRIYPDNADARSNLGLALSDFPNRLPEAIAHLQAALRISPGSRVVHNNLGNALSKIPGRLPEAVEEFQAALRIDPNYTEARNNLGLVLSKIPDRLPEAIAEFQKVLRINPDYPEAHNNLGLALSDIPERLPEAIAEFQAALRINPDYAEAHNNLGLALAKISGRLPEAIAEYQTAIRIDPDSPAPHNNLGLALARTGRLREAIAEFQAALRINHDFAEAHSNLGLALSNVPERVPEAITELEAALRIDPDSAISHNNLGLLFAKIPGRLPEAIAEFQAAVRSAPGYADAHNDLGIVVSQMRGRLSEAIAELEEGQRIRPDPELRQVLEQLRSGRR